MSLQKNEIVNVFGVPIPSSFDAILQVFKPGGITNVAGTPNFLASFDADTYQAQFREIQQGGLEMATFILTKAYEDITNVVFGNWIVYAQGGGYLHADAAAGSSTILVDKLASTNLTDANGLNVLNIQAGDNIIISDGRNTGQFVATSVTGTTDPRTITLGPAPGVNRSTTLNTFLASQTKVCRLVYQGIIQRRVRNTDMQNTYQIQALGMFNRYAQVMGNSVATTLDGATLVRDVLSSFTSTLPEIIYAAGNTVAASNPVTVNAQDARISEILSTILTQEASQSGTSTGTGVTSVIPKTLNFLLSTDPMQRTLFRRCVPPLTITSSDSGIATGVQGVTIGINTYVNVTPHGAGTCTLTVTDSNGDNASFSVHVQHAPMQTAGLVYAIGVGADRQVYHQLVPTDGTPTKTLDVTKPSQFGDVLAPLETTDMDGSAVLNAAIVRGGSDANGNRIRIIVRDVYSQSALNAWYEGTLDNSDITSEQELANWAAGQLAILAYPTTAAKLSLTTTSMRITTRDLVQINGFTDGSTLLVNPLEIQYTVDAKNQVATGDITLGVLRPQPKALTKELAKQKSIREAYNVPPVNLNQAFVINGLHLTQGSGLNFTISAGAVNFGGSAYPVAAYSGTATPNATSEYGVQVSGGVATVVPVPSVLAVHTLFAQNQYDISYRGGPPVLQTAFSGLPLYKIFSSSTGIINWLGTGPSGGPIALASLPFNSGFQQQDGSFTNVDGATASTVIASSGTVAGAVVHAEAIIVKGANSGGFVFPGSGVQVAGSGLYLFNGTTGYFVVWQSDGNFVLYKNAAGTVTALTSAYFPAINQSDTNAHFVQLTMRLITGGQVALTASIDNAAALTATTSTVGSLIGAAVTCQVSTGGSAGRVSRFALKCGVQAHDTAPTSLTTNLTSDGILKGSTMFVSTTPNTIAFVTDATIEFSWSGTGPYSVKIWYDNGTAGTDATVIWPDGSTSINLGHTTSASPSFSASSIPVSTNYYVVLHVQNGVVTLSAQTTPFTTAQFAAYFADGGIVAAAAQAGTPLFTTSGSGGSGGIAGGGGGHNLRA